MDVRFMRIASLRGPAVGDVGGLESMRPSSDVRLCALLKAEGLVGERGPPPLPPYSRFVRCAGGARRYEGKTSHVHEGLLQVQDVRLLHLPSGLRLLAQNRCELHGSKISINDCS